MLANDVIDGELRRLIKLTAQLSTQVRELTARLDQVEKRDAVAPERRIPE